ncbi:MAG: response regulator transcription factor [Planctomycetota bacterium]
MGRILIVDDEVRIRKLLAMACELEGHESVEAYDAASGVAAYVRKRPDLLILDLKMRGGGGAEVVKQIRFAEGAVKARLLVVSGHLDGLQEGERLALGADDYVDKPFKIADIRRRIRALLLPPVDPAE